MKVLFFHPANYLEIGIPEGIAVLSAILKQDGHHVELFETTFLKPKGYCHDCDEKMGGPAIYKKTPYTLEDLVKDDLVVEDITKEFQNKIDKFSPDLIAVSTMTTNYDFALEQIRKIKAKCPVIFGGAHPTISPSEVIVEKNVDMICIGEGEGAMLELCAAIEKDVEYTNIKNLWVKSKAGKIHKNSLRPFIDLNSLPLPDWTMFDQRHLYRPFEGKVYKGSFYMSSRGCPCGCTYCVNRTLQVILKDCGRYFRCQKPEVVADHLAQLKEKYGATWFKISDDTFLLRTQDDLKELRDRLKPLKIQFGCSVRPDTITEEKVKLAKEMGCVAMSIGIETGNEEIRRKVLNRQMSDQQIEKAFKIINELGIRISTFNLLGLPGETRANVFETIEFNRKLNVKSANVYIVYPFPGSHIFIQHKIVYKMKNGKILPMGNASVFHLSKMPPREVEGLKKTFNLYLALPKELWPIVELAEKSGKQSDKVYQALNELAGTIV
jgi:radical SAM superfamily enzyme YgiQ (UPF0313 family)